MVPERGSGAESVSAGEDCQHVRAGSDRIEGLGYLGVISKRLHPALPQRGYAVDF